MFPFKIERVDISQQNRDDRAAALPLTDEMQRSRTVLKRVDWKWPADAQIDAVDRQRMR
jgi:hypothetical protein